MMPKNSPKILFFRLNELPDLFHWNANGDRRAFDVDDGVFWLFGGIGLEQVRGI